MNRSATMPDFKHLGLKASTHAVVETRHIAMDSPVRRVGPPEFSRGPVTTMAEKPHPQTARQRLLRQLIPMAAAPTA